jgi:hypothetical protein
MINAAAHLVISTDIAVFTAHIRREEYIVADMLSKGKVADTLE